MGRIEVINSCRSLVGRLVFGRVSAGQGLHGAWHYSSGEYIQHDAHRAFIRRSEESSRRSNEIALRRYDRQQQFDQNHIGDSTNGNLQFGRSVACEGVVRFERIHSRSGCSWNAAAVGRNSNVRHGETDQILSGKHVGAVRKSDRDAAEWEDAILSTFAIW